MISSRSDLRNDHPKRRTGSRKVTALPRVTIGLPVFNGERYLVEAVHSLLAQDYADFQLLIADNGSTDATAELCRVLAAEDSRVSVHPSAVNRGAAWNFNRVVDLAAGEYFKWAAHDDLVRPAFLRRCVEVLDQRPDVSLVYTRAIDIDETGRVVGGHQLPAYAVDARPSRRLASVVLRPSPVFEAFGLTRRSQLLETSRLGSYTSSDRTLLAELALLGRFHEVPEVLFLRRQHPERSMRQYADAKARNEWFDPSWRGRRSAPRWRLLREYGAAVRRSPVPAAERVAALGTLSRWGLRHRRGLAREVASFMTAKHSA